MTLDDRSAAATRIAQYLAETDQEDLNGCYLTDRLTDRQVDEITQAVTRDFDPYLTAITRAVTALSDGTATLVGQRNRAIVAALDHGATVVSVAEAAGLSRQAIYNIRSAVQKGAQA